MTYPIHKWLKKIVSGIVILNLEIYAQSAPPLTFHYNSYFSPHLISLPSLHYTNNLNDPGYKPSITTENGESFVTLSAWPASSEISINDTLLQAHRIISLPPSVQKIQVSFELVSKTLSSAPNPPKMGNVALFLISESGVKKKIERFEPSPSWQKKSITSVVPNGYKKLMLQISALNGGYISTKNWKVRVE